MKRTVTRLLKGGLTVLCAIAASATQGVAAPSDLAVYPHATKIATPINSSYCGHKTALVTYQTAADGKTVGKWYANKIPGAVIVDSSMSDSEMTNTAILVYAPDASQEAIIHQVTRASSTLQAAAKSLGSDKTTLGLETFAPPLGADYLSLLQKAMHGDAAAKHSIEVRCPQG